MTKEEFIASVKAEILQAARYSDMSDDDLHEMIEQTVAARSGSLYLSISETVAVIEEVFSAIRGLGVLDEILSDEQITEVMINGPDDIFIEKSGRLMKLDRTFESRERLEDIVQRIVGTAGREVNQSNPIVDTRLMDGSRVNVVMPPIALNGPIITIRKFSKEPMTFEKLIKYGSVTPQIRDLLKELVEAKYNIFISGGTGSGKPQGYGQKGCCG